MQPKQPKAETQAMSEYGEPWVYSVNESEDEHYICDANGGHIVDCVGGDLLYEEIERIVACVNALAGIPNPEAVRELIEAASAWRTSTMTHSAERTGHAATISRLVQAVDSLTAPSAEAQAEVTSPPRSQATRIDD